ncbi:MAG: esterase, partial [Candidatus Levybacteria bacterium]|nr:esterase [Candidatus Levybacteria bacterium]
SWSANIDNFEIAFDYNPGPTPTSAPTPTPALTPTPTLISTPSPPLKTPLILIPGIAGSELKTAEETPWVEDDGHGFVYTHIYPKDETVWVEIKHALMPGNDDYFDILRMDKTGKLSMANLALTGNLFSGIYQGAINFFTSNGYELNKDLFLFPYDWRKDISETKVFLDQEIQQIKAKTGSAKVDIVAHSMGGLVARNYIADPEEAKNVRKLFTLGTPHLGAVAFLKNLRFGGCLTKQGRLTELAENNICLGISSSEVKDIVQNMIGAYELAPTRKYFDFYSGEDIDHSYPYNDVGDIDGDDITGALNYSQTKTMLDKLGHNTALFYPSEAFHQLDENLIITNDVEIYNIVGSGLPTVGQIIEKYTTNIFGETVSHKDQIFINGDETVPLMSASLIDYGKSHSLLGDAIIYYTKQEHGDLVASGSALLLVRNILNDDNSLPKDVSITPYNFNGTIVSGHSPINISVYDNSGNHTGLTDNGDIEINIPGSFYDTLDDAKFIYLPDEGTYSIKVEATDRGSFDLKIRKFENSANTVTTLYVNVPLTANTKAETVLDTSTGTPSILKLDENGDGTFEQDINYEDASTPTPIPTNSPSSGASSSLFSDQNNQNQIAQAISLSPTGVSIEDSISTVGEVAGAKTFGPIAESQKANSPNKNKSIAIVVLIGSVVAIMGLLRFKNRGKRVTS